MIIQRIKILHSLNFSTPDKKPTFIHTLDKERWSSNDRFIIIDLDTEESLEDIFVH